MTGLDFSTTGQWLSNDGPELDVVLSSRVRLARNLTGFRFTNAANRDELQQVLSLAETNATRLPMFDSLVWVALQELDRTQRALLVERHLISRNLLKRGDDPTAVIISPDESLSIMVNEEDHFRIQMMQSGFQLSTVYQTINEIDDQLEDRLQFAFHKRFGYLTACPTNIGTGIRVSVMLHLPGLTLTNEIERVRRAARDMHLAVRGFYGEGSEALGDLFQISNQTTFGKTEQNLLEEFENKVIPQIIEYERQARQILIKKRAALLEDRVYRALGILRGARLIKASEAMKLLSHVRLGIALGYVPKLKPGLIQRLILLSQPAHLQYTVGKKLNQAIRSQARASVIRKHLNDALGDPAS